MTGSLPLALGRLGLELLIVTPRHRGVSQASGRLAPNVEIHFVEHEAYFNRSGVYGNGGGDYEDNLQRFSFLCQEAIKTAQAKNFKPDLIHAHDWQTALLPAYLKTILRNDPFFQNTKSVLTIHNLAYQGQFPHRLYPETGMGEEWFSVDGFEFHGRANLLKAGILFADGVNTVSPTYAREIQTDEFGFGLDGVVRRRQNVLRGFLNGIDVEMWNPKTDRHIPKNYSAEDLTGKTECKSALQKACGLEQNAETPVLAIVSRLAEQKGFEIFSEIADKILSENVQLVLLGEGDSVYHTLFQNIRARHVRKVFIQIGFDAEAAHRIYSGADLFLMPSFFEPCGLGQMISLRYGTIPVVRKTGGLADTVVDVDQNPIAGNGFVFEKRSPENFYEAIRRALTQFGQKEKWKALQQRGMCQDFSWDKSAVEYKKYYEEILSL